MFNFCNEFERNAFCQSGKKSDSFFPNHTAIVLTLFLVLNRLSVKFAKIKIYKKINFHKKNES